MRVFTVWLVLAASIASHAYSDTGHRAARILFRFSGKADGGGPFGALVRDAQGNLYGTTAAGGQAGCESAVDAPGCGVVFMLSPPNAKSGGWTETLLHSFTAGTDGNGPLAGLVRDASGNVFGTTAAGGEAAGTCSAIGCGTVFEISPPAPGQTAWTETILHRFGSAKHDGTFPQGSLIIDGNGNLFGTTPSGGDHNAGTIYELSPQGGGAWQETVLHSFDGKDGSQPVGALLAAAGGQLYGTTSGGTGGGKLCRDGTCGTVFALGPPSGNTWPLSVLFRFPGSGKDGSYPNGGLVQDAQGALIGTTNNFGRRHGQQANGTVFRLSPPAQPGDAWMLRTLVAFTSDGTYPQAPVLAAGQSLYGTTMQAGSAFPDGHGLVFALTPVHGGKTYRETALFTFPKLRDGSAPLAAVIADQDGNLYGTTSTSGDASCALPFCGTVFSVTP